MELTHNFADPNRQIEPVWDWRPELAASIHRLSQTESDITEIIHQKLDGIGRIESCLHLELRDPGQTPLFNDPKIKAGQSSNGSEQSPEIPAA